MPGVSIIIVTWNSAGCIRACLDSIRALAPGCQTIVADNGSTDGTPEAVRQSAPWATLLDTGGNLGFPAACNLAARQAGGRLLLFLNPDTRLREDVPGILARVFARHADAGAAGPRILRPDGGADRFMARRFPSPALAFLRQFGLRKLPLAAFAAETPSRADTGPPAPVPCLTGAALMVPAALYAELGGMDERLPMYFEDLDLCARIRATGRRLYLAPEAVLIHAGGASAGLSAKRALLLAAEDGHAPWLFLATHRSPAQAALFRAVILGGSLFRLAAATCCRAASPILPRLGELAQRVRPRAAALLRWSLLPPQVFQAMLRALFDPAPGRGPAPTFSVLVHNRNRADALDRCLASIASQTCRPLEVILLDAGSTDGSDRVIAHWTERLRSLGMAVTAETTPPAGVSASRNMAARHATGDLLCFMDNDAELDSPRTLERARSLLAADPALAVIAFKILDPPGAALDARCWVHRRPPALWADTPFPSFTFAGTGFCIRAEAFREAGGFWDALAYSREEEELSLGLIARGRNILYAPQVAVRHHADRRGRMELAERRRAELRNGLMVLWRRLPLPLALVACVARTVSMLVRGLRRDDVPPGELLGSVPGAWRLWRASGSRRKPVSWRAAAAYAGLHFAFSRERTP